VDWQVIDERGEVLMPTGDGYTTRLTADERERWGDDEPALGTLDERLDIIIARLPRHVLDPDYIHLDEAY
jgi:hypothetical protein